MSVRNTKSYLINIPTEQLDQLLDNLFLSQLHFSLLDPKELGNEWEGSPYQKATDYSHETHIVNSLLEKWKPQGVLNTVIDHREPVSREDIEVARADQKRLWDITELFVQYYEDKHKLTVLQNYTLKAECGYIVGHKLDVVQREITEGMAEVVNQARLRHPEQHTDPEEGAFVSHIEHLDGLEIMSYDKACTDVVKSYIEDHVQVLEIHNYITKISSHMVEVTKKYSQHQANPLNPSLILKKQLSAYSVLLALHEKKAGLYPLIRKVEPQAHDVYLFINTTCSQKELSTYIPTEAAIEEVDWTEDIVHWKVADGLKGFKNIAKSLGTIGSKEIDPTGLLRISFTVFFAFCLGDALYGVFIVLLTGYFLYFTNLKKDLRDTFGLFFYSGLVSIVIGAFINSWAGDLFHNTAIDSVLSKFQLVDLLDKSTEHIPPFNSYLQNHGGASAIVGMLGVALLIGIIHLLTGYLLKISNALRLGNTHQALETGALLVFLITLGVAVATGIPAIILLGVGAMLVTKEGGIFKRIFGLFIELYHLISLFSDVLSYTRLIAIGLTGGIIAEVVNLLAHLAFEGTPMGVNYLAFVIILLIGHTFNFVLSVFSAYINPLRLHYVEFMPKFYIGKAREFKPINKDFEYADLVSPQTPKTAQT
jgi:vacuolar-type H+-ATPase subunit I/STV1